MVDHGSRMSQSAITRFVDQYTGYRDAPVWINHLREHAIEQFKQIGFPGLRDENWKYTDIRKLISHEFQTTDTTSADYNEALIQTVRLSDLDCYEVFFINGRIAGEITRALPGKLIIDSLDNALKNHTDLLREYLENKIDYSNGFNALNMAFLKNGVFIHIPDQTVIDKPICIHYLNTAGEQPHVTHPYNLLVMGKQSQATLIENYTGESQTDYLTNVVTNINLHEGANLTHYKLQQESRDGYHVSSTEVTQGKDSMIEAFAISLGGKLVRHDIKSDLNAPGASITLNGLYMATGTQHIDNHLLVNHLQPHTKSQEYYRGVLDQHARGVFNGKVIVHKDAQKSDAQQSNANLLLSDHAEIDTKPELEIYADDVKCSHGATVGQLDEDMLFYLRSRAINKDTAKGLLTYAFASDVLHRMNILPLRKSLESIVIGKLPDASVIREFAA